MTVQQELQVTRLREQGYGYATIAKSTGLTQNAVVVFCRKKGLTGCKAANSRVNIPPNICLQCGKSIEQIRGRKYRKFCSSECRTAYGNSHRKYCCHE